MLIYNYEWCHNIFYKILIDKRQNISWTEIKYLLRRRKRLRRNSKMYPSNRNVQYFSFIAYSFFVNSVHLYNAQDENRIDRWYVSFRETRRVNLVYSLKIGFKTFEQSIFFFFFYSVYFSRFSYPYLYSCFIPQSYPDYIRQM